MTIAAAVELTSETGFRMWIRPANPGDRAVLSDLYANVTKDDLRFRFLSAVPHVTASQIARMTEVDHQRTEDFMVFSGDTDHLIANAMLNADTAMETAEVAVTVHSAFKHQGIEKAVLEFVAENAKARGIKLLQAVESRENQDVIAIECKAGFTPRRGDTDPRIVVLEQRL